MQINRIICLSTVVIVLNGCAVALDEPPPQEDVLEEALPENTEVAAGWAAPAGDDGTVDDGWLADFDDDQLNALVAEAMESPNMQILSANVDRAQASAVIASAALKPTVSFGANASGTGGDPTVSGQTGQGGFGASWQPDVWGRIQAGVNAADENLRATEADFAAGRLSLAASVAKAWYLATELSLQTNLAQQMVDILSDTLDLVQKRQSVGQVSMQDVNLANADLATAKNALAQAKGGQQQARRSLELLLGRYPSGEIEAATELRPVPPPIPVGLPADLLERRPDLIAAERRVAAAFNVSEEARLARLPTFGINGNVGLTDGVQGLIGSLAAGLTAPLYTGGALEAQIDVANADQRAATAAYGAVVLTAFEQVEAALTNEDLLKSREEFLKGAVDNNKQAYDLAMTQYRVGQIDLLSTLQMQSRWLGSQVGFLDIQNQRLATRIDLHLALGGSFEATEDEPDE